MNRPESNRIPVFGESSAPVCSLGGVLVSEKVIDELTAEPWRTPDRTTEPDGEDWEYVDATPAPGSAQEVRELVASRVVLLHTTRRIHREALIQFAEERALGWLLDGWLPGLLSDWKRVGPRIVRFHEVLRALSGWPASEDAGRRRRLEQELSEVDRRLVGLSSLTSRPSLLVCEGRDADAAALREADRSGVPWLAPEAVHDYAALRLMRCAGRCATAARERSTVVVWRWALPDAPATLIDPMIAKSCVQLAGLDTEVQLVDSRTYRATGREDAAEQI
jgi:hypothetical protein